jgi:cytochrome P450
MSDLESINFYFDPSTVEDPQPYFDALRAKCPVFREPHFGAFAITGYDEAVAVYRDHETFSSCNSSAGPFSGLVVPPDVDDVSDAIAAGRDALPMSRYMVAMDAPEHTAHRGLLMRLMTPKRLKENEDFLWRLADRQLDEFLAAGRCEFIRDYSQPFALLAIADLLGVPEEDHRLFRNTLSSSVTMGEDGVPAESAMTMEAANALFEKYDAWFTEYVEDRRQSPRRDVLTQLAQATFPDGSIPPVADVVDAATSLFSAGQETTARLLAAALKYLAEDATLQAQLRDHRELIPDFLEEVLRIEPPVKSDFRLARRTTEVGGVEIPAGSTVMLMPGASNRDPRRFESPHELRMDRANGKEHIAFGRGVHACPGGPLARAEGRVSLERILDRMHDIRLSEAHHGPPGGRHFTYDPTFVLRGLTALHLEFTPVEQAG